MPKHFRISKVLFSDVEHRIAGIFCPRAAFVIAECQVLVLQRLFRVVSGVNGDQRWLAVLAKATGVVPIHHGAAREYHDAIGLGQGKRQMFPVNHVRADRVCPAHVSPLVAEGIILVEEVIFAVVEDHAVWVVHPVAFRREMILWSEWLGVIARRVACRMFAYHHVAKRYHREQLCKTGETTGHFIFKLIAHGLYCSGF